MQGSTPFHYQLTDMPALPAQVTDTASPRTPIPVYYIHSLKAPFCSNPLCRCHWQQREVMRLLGNIVEGNLTLKEAARLLDEVNGEGR